MAEHWLPVVGHEGRYEVSDEGSVRSVDGRDSRGHWRPGRVLHQTPSLSGHMKVTIAGTTRYVHHLVLDAFIGLRPDGTEGCHNDGNPANNALGNLRWGSRSSNMLDRVTHGSHNSARKVMCVRGHLLENPNLMPSVSRLGWRGCLACNRAHATARRRGIEFTPELADEEYRKIQEATL